MAIEVGFYFVIKRIHQMVRSHVFLVGGEDACGDLAPLVGPAALGGCQGALPELLKPRVLLLPIKVVEEGLELARKLLRIVEEHPVPIVLNKLLHAAVVGAADGHPAPEHVHDLHGEVEARGGDVETDPKIRGGDQPRVVLCRQPHQLEGHLLELHAIHLLAVKLPQRALSGDDEKELWIAAETLCHGIVPLSGFEQDAEVLVRGPAGAADHEGGPLGIARVRGGGRRRS
mmetsp:Transcript_1631/g.4635  ORF Transcript_1631/g.4635 Transcript_1631/m.4635 type:complete len:230 (-) Transcript_1631:764-1453(-)